MAVQELVLMMALGVCKLLKPLSFMGNPVRNWQEFKEQLTWFIPGTESSEIRIMLTHAGRKCMRFTKHFLGLNLTIKCKVIAVLYSFQRLLSTT